MAEVRRFPYKGRRLATFESTDGTTIITYEASQQEIDRISTTYGQNFIYANAVYVAQYDKGSTSLKTFPNGPAGDQSILGGISNVDLVASINSDPNFYRQATGTTTQTPTSQTQDQQGGSTPLPPAPTNTQPTDVMLVYPTDLGSYEQDRIMFQAYDYKSGAENRLPGTEGIIPVLSSPIGNKVGPAVILPIQSSIIDQNSVGWESDVLDPVSLYAANASVNLMKAGGMKNVTKEASTYFTNAIENLRSSSEEVRVALAGAAIGNNNLLSRLQGKVLNPNLELLFQGPQLRPFNYTFKMSARNRPEAVTIKKIIKYFKQNMAVKKGNQIFLKAPNVFKIQYQYKNSGKEHNSLNLIKICALTNCSIDYTPLGTYMTYSDGEGTMVAYTMTLSFQELTPIYDTDYTDKFEYGNGDSIPAGHPIGA